MRDCINLEEIVPEKDITLTKLSKITHLSQSNLWKTINGQVPMNFSKLMKILVNTETEDQKMEIVQGFLKSTDKEADIRAAMYYTYLAGYTDILHTLLERDCRQSVTKHYKEIFKVGIERQSGNLRSKDFFKRLDDLRAKVNLNKVNINILVNLLSIYGYSDMGAYNLFVTMHDMIRDKLYEMPDGLEKTLINTELNILCAYAYLMQDEVENARNLLYEVLNIAEMPCLLKATAYSVLGESYIFTNVEKSIHYFKISLQELHKITNSKSLLKRKLVENTLAFCCIIRKIPVKSSYIHDIAEQALLKIFLNEHDAAAEMLYKIENRTAFQDLYLAVATKNSELRKKAYHRFLKDGNLFYIKIFDILK
ncbi:AimR family lysis-lysogeny pheromone receptor [Bacillus cytotoxicus]|uniref:AimR family lysis-lysogeny pheromone receptor n=1 Tax=Bacillus cytotoxicus TaxID=580165 RepID=UPI002447A028|nr:AimR family lysis-lysogeny pheromone receptor [Bacillus cytotoxicus]MDH2884414.1 AimR family lysis-lysogeny pheromone receptor [Bacillus cytotoxicus]